MPGRGVCSASPRPVFEREREREMPGVSRMVLSIILPFFCAVSFLFCARVRGNNQTMSTPEMSEVKIMGAIVVCESDEEACGVARACWGPASPSPSCFFRAVFCEQAGQVSHLPCEPSRPRFLADGGRRKETSRRSLPLASLSSSVLSRDATTPLTPVPPRPDTPLLLMIYSA